MGGKGSGRKPDMAKKFLAERTQIAGVGGKPFELPNYSGVERYAKDKDIFQGGGVGTDVKVAVDTGATADFLGAASNDGVLRTGAPLTYTDGGDFVTIDIDETSIDHDVLTNTHNLTTDVDHGNINGLGDDDHTIYSLADGTRAFSAVVVGVTPTSSTHLATKGYVDTFVQGVDWQESVLDKDLATPPGAPSSGDRYIVASGGTDAWSGEDNNIAEWNGSSWDFTAAAESMSCWVEDENVLYVYNGSAWVKLGSTTDHGNLLGLADDDHSQYHTDGRADTWLGTKDLDDVGDGTSYERVAAAELTAGIYKDATTTTKGIASFNTNDYDVSSGAVSRKAASIVDGDIDTSADILIDKVGITIDGGGSAITTGIKGYIEVPYNCTILAVTMLADQSGSAVVDIWKDTYANYPPTDADTITAAAVPTISAATKSQDNTLTGWTTSTTAGDILGFNVDSAATIERLTLILKVKKT